MNYRNDIKPLQYLLLMLLSACAPQPENIKNNTNNENSENLYQIKSGDTLYHIAINHHLDYKKLAKWNNISPPYTIHQGQSIRLNPLIVNSPIISHSLAESTNITNNQTLSLWLWPTQGTVIKDQQNNELKGIKINGKISQPIYSSQKGKVIYRGKGLRGYGKLIIVKHEHHYLSTYGFNKKIFVKEGDLIKKGDKIAEMGLSNGQPILYFEIRRNGQSINPLKLLPKNN